MEEKTVLKTVDTLTNRTFYTIALTEGEDKPTYLIGTEYEGRFSFFLMSLMPEEAPFVGDSTDFRGKVELSFLDGTNKQYLYFMAHRFVSSQRFGI